MLISLQVFVNLGAPATIILEKCPTGKLLYCIEMTDRDQPGPPPPQWIHHWVHPSVDPSLGSPLSGSFPGFTPQWIHHWAHPSVDPSLGSPLSGSFPGLILVGSLHPLPPGFSEWSSYSCQGTSTICPIQAYSSVPQDCPSGRFQN